MVQVDKILNCVCPTSAIKEKGQISQTANDCVCSVLDQTTRKEEDIGFPITINIVKDSDEPKRQRRERGIK